MTEFVIHEVPPHFLELSIASVDIGARAEYMLGIVVLDFSHVVLH